MIYKGRQILCKAVSVFYCPADEKGQTNCNSSALPLDNQYPYGYHKDDTTNTPMGIKRGDECI